MISEKINVANFFYVYPSYSVTIGFRNSVIVDSESSILFEIPKELGELLVLYNKNKIYDAVISRGVENKETLIEYFQWLYEKNIIYLASEQVDVENFMELSKSWETPYEITNGIIDINENSIDDAVTWILEFLNINIPHIELRFFCSIKEEDLEKIIEKTMKSDCDSVVIYIPFNEGLNEVKLEHLVKKNMRILAIYVYNSPEEKKLTFHNKQSQIIYVLKNISVESCGVILQKYFNPTKELQLESIDYNTCLNKKISIDVNGEIKNCPSMQKSYGNIKDTTLKEALNKQGFKDVWTIKKDEIKVCQDCEFRYICIDCRAYLENPNDLYSKPLKCGYNPYSGTWEEWSTNPLKQKAIAYYGMN